MANDFQRTAACKADYLENVATDEAEEVSAFDGCNCKKSPMGHFKKIEPIAEDKEGSSDKVLNGLLEKAKKDGDNDKVDAYTHLLADKNDVKIAFIQYAAKKTPELVGLLKSYKSNVASSEEWLAWAKKNGKPDNMSQKEFDAFSARQKDYGEQMQLHVDTIKKVLKLRGETVYAADDDESERKHPRKGGQFTSKAEQIKDEKADFKLEFSDGSSVIIKAKNLDVAKVIASAVAKRVDGEVKGVSLVKGVETEGDAHAIFLNMSKEEARSFLGDFAKKNVSEVNNVFVDFYDSARIITNVDCPKLFGANVVAKKVEIIDAFKKIVPFDLLHMNTKYGDKPIHVIQYTDMTRFSVTIPSLKGAKTAVERDESRVKFREKSVEAYEKARKEGKKVKVESELAEVIVTDNPLETGFDRLQLDRDYYHEQSRLVDAKISLHEDKKYLDTIQACYQGGEEAKAALEKWNKKHNLSRKEYVGEVALDESEQGVTFDEMKRELQATYDEENGEVTVPMTVAAFDAWEESKHPRNHGKFAKKGESSSSNSIRNGYYDNLTVSELHYHKSTLSDIISSESKVLEHMKKNGNEFKDDGISDELFQKNLEGVEKQLEIDKKSLAHVERLLGEKQGGGNYLSGLSDVELGKKIADVRNGKSKEDLGKLTAEQDRRYAEKCSKMTDDELAEEIQTNRNLVDRYGEDKDTNPYVRNLTISKLEKNRRDDIRSIESETEESVNRIAPVVANSLGVKVSSVKDFYMKNIDTVKGGWKELFEKAKKEFAKK